MTTDGEGGTDPAKRFDVELFIVHPTMDPAAITAALGLQPAIVHGVGNRRTTPKGTVLPGHYPDTRWRHSVRHETEGQWFRHEVAALLDQLAPHKAFLEEVRATDGQATVIVQFLGDGYFGDELGPDLLGRLIDLRLGFAVEVYGVPQSP